MEQPPPFSGFDPSSAVRISRHPDSETGFAVQFVRRGFDNPFNSDGLPEGLDSDLPPGIIRRGDVIEVAGSRFEITDTDPDVDANGFYKETSGDPDGELWIRPVNPAGQLANFSDRDPNLQDSDRRYLMWTQPLRYKILRRPSRTSDEPYQLPEGTAIDLRASGIGHDKFFYNMDPIDSEKRVDNPYDVTILFAPEGRIARRGVQPAGGSAQGSRDVRRPRGGKRVPAGRQAGKHPAPRAANDPTLATLPAPGSPGVEEKLDELKSPINWLSGTSRWVVIGAQSGRVVSVENAFVDLYAYINPTEPGDRRNQQIIAAREFTREMSQLGEDRAES